MHLPSLVSQTILLSRTLTTHSTMALRYSFPWLPETLFHPPPQHLICKVPKERYRKNIETAYGSPTFFSYLQVHENCGYPLSPIPSVIFIHEVVVVRLVLLPNLIVQNLKTFPMLCML